jgi:hypothetical protein
MSLTVSPASGSSPSPCTTTPAAQSPDMFQIALNQFSLSQQNASTRSTEKYHYAVRCLNPTCLKVSIVAKSSVSVEPTKFLSACHSTTCPQCSEKVTLSAQTGAQDIGDCRVVIAYKP